MAYIVLLPGSVLLGAGRCCRATRAEPGRFPGYGAFTHQSGRCRRHRRRPIRRGMGAGRRRADRRQFSDRAQRHGGLPLHQRFTAGSVPGFTAGKLTDLVRAWATGGP